MKITDQEGRAAVRRVLEACLTAGIKITTSVPPQDTDDDILVRNYVDQLIMDRDCARETGPIAGVLRDVGPNDVIVIHAVEMMSMRALESLQRGVKDLSEEWGIRFLVVPAGATVHCDRVVED